MLEAPEEQGMENELGGVGFRHILLDVSIAFLSLPINLDKFLSVTV